MANWDVFHADRLELERGLDARSIQRALARGDLRDDDLVRPAGTSIPWVRLAEMPELITPAGPAADAPRAEKSSDFEEVGPRLERHAPPAVNRHQTELPERMSTSDVTFPVLNEPIREPAPRDQAPAPPSTESRGWAWDEEEDEDEEDITEDEEDIEILDDSGTHQAVDVPPPAAPRSRPAPAEKWEPGENDLELNDRPDSRSSHVALPVVRSRDRDSDAAMEEEADPDASFSLARSATTKVEELDLAPMVDVAFNLVLFFMVTASTILFKTLEIPKPSSEAPASAVAQGRNRSLDDLKSDYILVEIDEQGAMRLDREPIEATMPNLVELLRRAREKTGRKSMLLSANFATPHRNAVLAYDAANEIGLSIAIARPQAPLGPAPALRPGAPAAAPKRAPEPEPAPPT